MTTAIIDGCVIETHTPRAESRSERELGRKMKARFAAQQAMDTARRCRKEMRDFALWWRRGSGGSTPQVVIKGAVMLRNTARNMEAQAERNLEFYYAQ